MSAQKQPRMPPALLVERVLSVMTVLGLACLGIGLTLHIAGRAFNDLFVARVGAYILLFGIMVTVMRIIYWIAEEMIGRGLESVQKEDTLSRTRLKPSC